MLKRTITTLFIVATFATALFASTPGIPTDYTYIGPGQNGFDLYGCPWAFFEFILAKVLKDENGDPIGAVWVPYNKGTYDIVPIQEKENLPPGYYINAGALPSGHYLAHCYFPKEENFPYKFIWIKENKVTACTGEEVMEIVTSVEIYPVKE